MLLTRRIYVEIVQLKEKLVEELLIKVTDTIQPNVKATGQGLWQETVDFHLCKQLFAHSAVWAQLSKQVSGKQLIYMQSQVFVLKP